MHIRGFTFMRYINLLDTDIDIDTPVALSFKYDHISIVKTANNEYVPK